MNATTEFKTTTQ